MSKQLHTTAKVILAIAAVLALPGASFAQVKVIMSGGFTAVSDLLPEFEKTTGIKVTTARGPSQGNGPDSIGSQLASGVPADVVIMSREGMDDLVKDGRIVPKTDTNLAQVPLVMAVRTGAPKPEIGTVNALRETLLHAKSITFPNHASGMYMKDKVLSELGITKTISAVITDKGAATVASGESEIAILPLSEFVHAPGVDLVGTLPAKVQYISVFSAGIVKGAKEPEAAKRLIAFLASDAATKAIKKSGMEPPQSR